MAIALSIFGYMLAVVYSNGTWALGFLLGSAWSVANLYIIKGLVELVITPHTGSLRRIALHAVFKFPLLYAGGYFILSAGGYTIWAPMAGFSLPFVVIVLKACGRLLLGIEGSGPGRKATPVGTTHS